MNATLAERLDIFRAMPTVPDEAVDLVTEELTGLDATGSLTDEEAGLFVSHAVNALTRLVGGDDSVQSPSDSVYQQVLDADPSAAGYAHAFAERVTTRLGQSLPEAELKFMTIHFAALRQHLGKENR